MAEPEVIVVCIDNSLWVPQGSSIFQTQCDAVKFYCQAKLQANPETVVSLFTMSSYNSGHFLYPPTGSFEEIVAKLPRIYTGMGQLNLLRTLSFGRIPLVEAPYNKKRKRMALFVGGITNLGNGDAKDIGMAFKKAGVAVDVVDFYLGKPYTYARSDHRFGFTELQKFVDTCNDNDNSHIVHVGPKSSIRDLLSESILKTTPRLSHKQNDNVKRRVGGEESSAAPHGIGYAQNSSLSKGKAAT